MQHALILAAGSLVACGSGSPSDKGPTDTSVSVDVASVELGTGEFSHTPLTDGDDVVLVDGPQSGWHIDVSGTVSGLPLVVNVHTWGNRADDGTELVHNRPGTFLQLAEYDDTTSSGLFAGERSTSNDQGILCSLEGVELELCTRVEQIDDPTVAAEDCAIVFMRFGPEAQASCGT